MKRLFVTLLAAGCMLAALSVPVAAKEKKYQDPGLGLIPISAEQIITTDTAIKITEPSLFVAGVTTVYLNDDPLEIHTDYSIRKDREQSLIIQFKSDYLKSIKPANYIVRVEFVSHVAETTFIRDDTEGYYSATPPKTKW